MGGILGLLLEYPDFLKDVIVHIAIGYEYSQLRLIEILLIGISGNGLAVKLSTHTRQWFIMMTVLTDIIMNHCLVWVLRLHSQPIS